MNNLQVDRHSLEPGYNNNGIRSINSKSQGLCIALSFLSASSSSFPVFFYTPVVRIHCSSRFYLFRDHIIPIHCSHKKRSAYIFLFLHQFALPLCVPGSHKNDNTRHHENRLSVFLSIPAQSFFPAYLWGS